MAETDSINGYIYKKSNRIIAMKHGHLIPRDLNIHIMYVAICSGKFSTMCSVFFFTN